MSYSVRPCLLKQGLDLSEPKVRSFSPRLHPLFAHSHSPLLAFQSLQVHFCIYQLEADFTPSTNMLGLTAHLQILRSTEQVLTV